LLIAIVDNMLSRLWRHTDMPTSPIVMSRAHEESSTDDASADEMEVVPEPEPTPLPPAKPVPAKTAAKPIAPADLTVRDKRPFPPVPVKAAAAAATTAAATSAPTSSTVTKKSSAAAVGTHVNRVVTMLTSTPTAALAAEAAAVRANEAKAVNETHAAKGPAKAHNEAVRTARLAATEIAAAGVSFTPINDPTEDGYESSEFSTQVDRADGRSGSTYNPCILLPKTITTDNPLGLVATVAGSVLLTQATRRDRLHKDVLKQYRRLEGFADGDVIVINGQDTALGLPKRASMPDDSDPDSESELDEQTAVETYYKRPIWLPLRLLPDDRTAIDAKLAPLWTKAGKTDVFKAQKSNLVEIGPLVIGVAERQRKTTYAPPNDHLVRCLVFGRWHDRKIGKISKTDRINRNSTAESRMRNYDFDFFAVSRNGQHIIDFNNKTQQTCSEPFWMVRALQSKLIDTIQRILPKWKKDARAELGVDPADPDLMLTDEHVAQRERWGRALLSLVNFYPDNMSSRPAIPLALLALLVAEAWDIKPVSPKSTKGGDAATDDAVPAVSPKVTKVAASTKKVVNLETSDDDQTPAAEPQRKHEKKAKAKTPSPKRAVATAVSTHPYYDGHKTTTVSERV
jgi:hypothetical protein